MEGIFEETGKKLTVAEVAIGLGTIRKTLSANINGKQRVTLKLGTAFANTILEFWLTVQENYDLSQARQKVDTRNVRVFWKPAVLSAQYI